MDWSGKVTICKSPLEAPTWVRPDQETALKILSDGCAWKYATYVKLGLKLLGDQRRSGRFLNPPLARLTET
jgi:hypothetical protein